MFQEPPDPESTRPGAIALKRIGLTLMNRPVRRRWTIWGAS
jgi:hypothetical protein